MRPVLLLLLLIAGPAFGQARMGEADARAFVARQEQAWNAGALDRYFAAFTPDARFTDQAYVGDKPPVSYGTATLAQARLQAGKSRPGAKPQEAGRILRIALTRDGHTAQVESSVVSRVGGRRLCATRMQTLILAHGTLRSRGQTDTYIRCRRG